MKKTQSTSRQNQSYVRPLVQCLTPYVPGEQPSGTKLIKLNTNENPYPPSPRVLQAIKKAVDGSLRLYPNPTAAPLREKLAKLHKCSPDNIIVGNGSDELLEMATRAFVEPISSGMGSVHAPAYRARLWTLRTTSRRHSTIQYFTPSYSLYPVLADIHGCLKNPVPLNPDFSLPSVSALRRGKVWDFHAILTYITTPNAPTGRSFPTAELEAICRMQQGVIILDEAYAEFADAHALTLALKHPNVIVSRTFSKAYALCGLRVGYFVGPRDLIGALHKIRDSYNVNALAQVGALATLDDLGYYQKNIAKIRAARRRLTETLSGWGFEVFPSQTNFLFVRPPELPASQWVEELRRRKILVRWFDDSEVRDFLRVSIGTDAENEAFLKAVKQILSRA